MAIQVKICGITTPETLDAAIAGGASHIGLNFFPKSPRYSDFALAAGLAARAGGAAKIVGLFVNPERGLIDEALLHVKLDVVQLHGDESPAFLAQTRGKTAEVWKALPVRTSADLQAGKAYQGAADQLLYDAKPPRGAALPGGNGLRFDWRLLEGFQHPLPWILSGGLDAANIGEAVGVTHATFLDVSSGVESAPGVKDVDKIAAFLKAAHSL